jgi:hypothetical protein
LACQSTGESSARTLQLVIAPAFVDEGDEQQAVNRMDLWRSGEQVVWIMPQEVKVALLQTASTSPGPACSFRHRADEEGICRHAWLWAMVDRWVPAPGITDAPTDIDRTSMP